jgi:hypothetical protein
MGVGAGVRFRLTKYLIGRVDVGYPLFKLATYPQAPQLHFGLQSELF